MEAEVNGKFSLQQQEDTLSATENKKFKKLVKYEKGDKKTQADGTVVTRNFASFEDDDSTDDLPELRLVPVPSNKTTASVLASEQAKGRKKMFVTTIFVKNEENKVVAFREAAEE